MSKMKAVAGVARLPFLILPVTLIASGAASGALGGEFSWLEAALALAGLLALHAAVNILNEASDMRTGIDMNTKRTPFSGGSGTLPSGAMSVGVATALGLTAAAIGLAVGIRFLYHVGLPMIPFLVIGAVLALGYTDMLARAGIGEIAAGLGLGALPVVGTDLVMDGAVEAASVAASIPAFFMTFNLLLLNEFPDEKADRAGGRRNLVILLGRQAAAWIYILAALAVPVSIVAAVFMKALPPMALIAAFPTVLLAPALKWAAAHPMEPVPIPGLGANVFWNLATNTLVATGILITLWAS
jgi:1,4-dihydroxy-2-naphthoate octaprenyltransferase